MISVVIPTVAGREDYFNRCRQTYLEASEAKLELIVLKDEPTCGMAWEKGAELATGEYLHFTADDLTPRPGWDAAAIDTVENGALPTAVIWNGLNGSFESCGGALTLVADGCLAPAYNAVPFFSAEQWAKIGPMGPMAQAHYYTDNWLSFRAAQVDIPIRVRHDYAFDHHWAQAKRGAGMDAYARMDLDRQLFERASRG